MRQYKQSNAKTLWVGVIFWPLFSLAVTLLVLATPVHAADDNTAGITVDPAAQLTRQGNFYKATTNVKVKTGKSYGFDLTMKADGNGDLVNTVDPSHRISNMQGNSMYSGIRGIPANSWGYHSGDWHHNGSTIPVYGHVPAAKDNETTLLGVTAAEQKSCSTNHSNCSKDVVFAANIDPSKLASGSYSASIMYTATARPKPAPIVEPTVCKSGDPKNDCQVDIDPNMIPVKYTGSTTHAEWTSLSSPEDAAHQGNWYNYNNKQWANAVTVKDPSKYKNQTKVVDQADILGFWVYIPRYAYEVMRRDGTDKPVPAQNFLISFEKTSTPKRVPATCPEQGKDYREDCGLNRDYRKGQPSNQGTWATHPAFTFGKKELNGIWFAKFETTGTGDKPTVLPNESNVSSFYGTIDGALGDLYSIAKTLGVSDPQNVGGESVVSPQNSHHLAKLSSHMVNNNDWGAATYLSASKYGAGYNGVQINSKSDSHSVTGCGPYANGDTDTYGSGNDSLVKHKGISTGPLSTQQACSSDGTRAYNGTLGQLASTTNNPTGIYDMSGGGWEYVAASYTTNLNESGVSTDGDYFGTKAHPPYVNTYNITNLNSCTFTTCGGQALYETNNGTGGGSGSNQWNGQYLDMGDFSSSYSWFMRGGTYNNGSDAGLFYASVYSGYTLLDNAFRVALAPTV